METKTTNTMFQDAPKIIGLLEEIKQNTLIAAKNILTLDEAASFTGFKPNYLRQIATERKVPYYRNGKSRRYYFKREELEAWMTSQKVEAEEEADAAAILRDYINS